MPTSTADKDPRSRVTSRRGSPKRLRNRLGSADLRALMDRRNRLYRAAQKNPDSEAGEMVQMFVLSGMLADAAGQRRARPADRRRTAQLEFMVREQRAQLDEIARIAEEAKAKVWDPRRLSRRIAEMVGLAPPSDIDPESEEFKELLSHPEREEELCQRYRSRMAAQAAPITE